MDDGVAGVEGAAGLSPVLVAGATGATGRLLVEQLLDRGLTVKAVVRSPDRLPAALRARDALEVVHAAVLDLTDAELAAHVRGCAAVASCLGHTLSLRGIYGRPRMLVSEATRRLCAAIRANEQERPVRFVLMNTAGNRNRAAGESVSFAERCLVGVIRALLPPHLDNERAARVLQAGIGTGDDPIEWAVVRPDSLVDEAAVSDYDVHPSPVRSALFDPGTTSRINVAHFMAELMAGSAGWEAWRGKMPVIYNREVA